MTGICEHCGQTVMVVYPSGINGQEEYDQYATRMCDCDGAKRERETIDQLGRAQVRVTELFEDGLGAFTPIECRRIIALLHEAVEIVGHEMARSIKIELPQGIRANVVRSGDAISVERSEAKKYKFKE